jgi:hypothetical protein
VSVARKQFADSIEVTFGSVVVIRTSGGDFRSNASGQWRDLVGSQQTLVELHEAIKEMLADLHRWGTRS